MGAFNLAIFVTFCLVGYLEAVPVPASPSIQSSPDSHTDSVEDIVEELFGSDSAEDESSHDEASTAEEEESFHGDNDDSSQQNEYEAYGDSDYYDVFYSMYPGMDEYDMRERRGDCPTMDISMCWESDFKLKCGWQDREPSTFMMPTGIMCRGCLQCKDGSVLGQSGIGEEEVGSERSASDEDESGEVELEEEESVASTTSSTTTKSSTENKSTTAAATRETSTTSTASTTVSSTTASTTTTAKSSKQPDLSIKGPNIPRLPNIAFPAFPESAVKFIRHSLNLQDFELGMPTENSPEEDDDLDELHPNPECPSLDCSIVEETLPCPQNDMVKQMMFVRSTRGMIRCEVCRKCRGTP